MSTCLVIRARYVLIASIVDSVHSSRARDREREIAENTYYKILTSLVQLLYRDIARNTPLRNMYFERLRPFSAMELPASWPRKTSRGDIVLIFKFPATRTSLTEIQYRQKHQCFHRKGDNSEMSQIFLIVNLKTKKKLFE